MWLLLLFNHNILGDTHENRKQNGNCPCVKHGNGYAKFWGN